MTSFAQLRHYIHKQFTVLTATIEPHHRLQQDLGLSPVEATEVIVMLEVLSGVTLPDEVLVPTLSGGQLCALVDQYATNSVDKSSSEVRLLYKTTATSKLA